jgi:hypothetical protein
MMGAEVKVPGALGKMIATGGVVMIAVSIVMAMLGVAGPIHDVLQYGGVAAGVVGIILWRIVKV